MFTATFRIAALGAAAVVAAACAGPTYHRSGYRDVSPEQARIAFNAPAFEGTEASRVAYRSVNLYQEYALFQGNGARAEVVLFLTPETGGDTVLAFEETTETATATWNAFAGHRLSWGEARLAEAGIGRQWVRPFRDETSGRDCAAFTATWDVPPLDDPGRPSKAYFGFYCAPPGGSPEDAVTAAAGIGVRGISQPKRPRAVDPMAAAPARQAELAVIAGAGSGTGNRGFPYDLARQIRTTEDAERWWVN